MACTEFFLIISPDLMSTITGLSKDDYQILTAHKVCEYLEYALKNQQNILDFSPSNVMPNLKPCCLLSSKDSANHSFKANHSVHYVFISVPIAWLKHCSVLIIPDLSIGKQELEECLHGLTLGQTAWLAKLALRTLTFSKNEWLNLSHDLNISNNLELEMVRRIETNQNSCLFLLNQSNLSNQKLILSHDRSHRSELWSRYWIRHSLFPNFNVLRSYFGDEVGFYFVWMKSYCLYLLFGPLVFGLFCKIYNYFINHSYPTSLSLFYCISIILWSILCTKLWTRKYITCVDRWSGNQLIELLANDYAWLFQSIDQRPNFCGYWRKSPVTGDMELHYSAAKRRLRYLVSVLITLLCLFCAGFVNVLLLNLQGLICPVKSPWLFFDSISQLAKAEALFDPNHSGLLHYVPGILHSLLVFVMNQILFRRVAELLTEWENHKTNEEHAKALIIKRFLFELIDAYGCLFYLGFIVSDHKVLKSLLLTMFTTDSVRRITLECIVPYLNYRMKLWISYINIGKRKRQADNTENTKFEDFDILKRSKDFLKDPYEEFDDYLEMILQHGYIVMFAFVSPYLVPILATFCTLLEAHFDAFKLFWITQRAEPKLLIRGQSIWLFFLTVQTWLAVLTNAGLLTSHLMSNPIGWEGNEFCSSFIFLLFEHLMIFIGFGIQFGISNVPAHVRDAKRSRDYERTRLIWTKNLGRKVR